MMRKETHGEDDKCEMCGLKFVQLQSFIAHIALSHVFKCNGGCELSFVSQYDLNLHRYQGHAHIARADQTAVNQTKNLKEYFLEEIQSVKAKVLPLVKRRLDFVNMETLNLQKIIENIKEERDSQEKSIEYLQKDLIGKNQEILNLKNELNGKNATIMEQEIEIKTLQSETKSMINQETESKLQGLQRTSSIELR